MRGARKTALNGAQYLGGYQRLAYPGGDVPRDRGVCTDVVVRALRNGGYDLQSLMYRDMKRAPRAYGLRSGQRPDRHIEHRRVRRQIVFFKRHYHQLPPTFRPEQRELKRIDRETSSLWIPCPNEGPTM